jgi:hypothetical protein
MEIITAMLFGTLCSPVQIGANRQARFSLKNEAGIFLIKVPGRAQVRICQTLTVGDAIYLLGHLHSFRSQKCRKHHVYFEAATVIPQEGAD